MSISRPEGGEEKVVEGKKVILSASFATGIQVFGLLTQGRKKSFLLGEGGRGSVTCPGGKKSFSFGFKKEGCPFWNVKKKRKGGYPPRGGGGIFTCNQSISQDV